MKIHEYKITLITKYEVEEREDSKKFNHVKFINRELYVDDELCATERYPGNTREKTPLKQLERIALNISRPRTINEQAVHEFNDGLTSLTDVFTLFSHFDTVDFIARHVEAPRKQQQPGWLAQMIDKRRAQQIEKSEAKLKAISASFYYALPPLFHYLVWLPGQSISTLKAALANIELHPLTTNHLRVHIVPEGTPTCCNKKDCHSLCSARQVFLKDLNPSKDYQK